MGERVLGEFEHQVLLAILREGSESYSVQVVLELERRTEREVATAAVYVALTRLERKDFVSSRMVEPEGAVGHVRRYFRLTPEGLNALRASRRTLLSLWEGVEPLLDER